jgi:hypothetical protein
VILIQAKFKGKDSLGFINGNTYYLSLKIIEIFSVDNSGSYVEVESNTGYYPKYNKLRCQYGNTKKFLENWIPIKVNNIEGNINDSANYTLSEIRRCIRQVKIDSLMC